MSEPHTDPREELREAIALTVASVNWPVDRDVTVVALDRAVNACADALLASEQFTIGLRDDLEDDIAESMQDPAFREAFRAAEARSEEESVTFDGEDPDDAARWLLASDDEADAHLAFNDWFNTSDVPLRGTPNSLAAAFVAGAGWESHR